MTRSSWIYYHAFISAIIAANVLINMFGAATIFGLVVPWGTFCAGATFVLRDLIHRDAGMIPVLSAIVLGAVFSYAFTNPALALASGVAFLLSELADTTIFVWLRRTRTTPVAVLCSGLVGAAIDTAIFLPWSGIPMTVGLVAGQLIVKSLMSGLAAAAMAAPKYRYATT